MLNSVAQNKLIASARMPALALPKNVEWFWLSFSKFRCDWENFFEYHVSTDKEEAWILDFLTKEIEPFFLDRMICYKRYFLQAVWEYKSKQNTDWRSIIFIIFQRKIFIPLKAPKIQDLQLEEGQDLIQKNNSGINLILRWINFCFRNFFQVLKDKKKKIFCYFFHNNFSKFFFHSKIDLKWLWKGFQDF